MPRRQLMVPGTGGILYTGADGKQVGSIFDLLTDPKAPALLACKHPADASVLDPIGSTLTPSGHVGLAYAPFDQAVLPKWSFFDYDWRLDIRRSGRNLVNFLEAQAPSGDRWHVACHSQGGLVFLMAARQLGAQRLAELVRSVVFVGVPFFGTVNALVALLAGTLFGNKVPKEIVRTWPSVYQMMPTWSIATSTPNDADLLLGGTWAAAGLWPQPGQVRDLAAHIDPDLLQRAIAFQELTRVGLFDPLRQLEFVRIIQGNNLPTPLTLPGFPDQAGAALVMGDTLVPDQFTRDRLPSWVKDEATIRRFPAAEHMLLCSDPNVYGFCL